MATAGHGYVDVAGSKHHGRRRRHKVRYTKTRRASRRRIAILRDRLKAAGKKGSKKAYGLTYYHKKTKYPTGVVATASTAPAVYGSVAYYGSASPAALTPAAPALAPEEDITYKKVHAMKKSGAAGKLFKERIRALKDRRRRRSRIRVRV
ncbi:hypothetical protein HDU67_004746 [Dinochytrium kinnereticum]|nr:hypothetical protein HDU67_004746 [Dinochytrium kinnereticum]